MQGMKILKHASELEKKKTRKALHCGACLQMG